VAIINLQTVMDTYILATLHNFSGQKYNASNKLWNLKIFALNRMTDCLTNYMMPSDNNSCYGYVLDIFSLLDVASAGLVPF